MSHPRQDSRTLKVLLYSDDRGTRDEIRLALGRRLAADLPELEIFDTATAPAALKAVRTRSFDLLVLDGETVPLGGMGLSKQLKDELPDCPPVALLVARVADAWLATWSHADAVIPYPVDPVRLPATLEKLVRARLAAPAVG